MRWERVEELAERAPTVGDLLFHRLELVAARRLRARGAALPQRLADAERSAAVTALAAPIVMRLASEAYGGTMALLKGPEIALRYPDPALRPYLDLDLLCDDAQAAHRALLAAGFAPAGMWADHLALHHLRPLCWPGLPIGVELHSRVHAPSGLDAPPTAELLAGAVPARFGGGRVAALAPAAHALVVAAHAWAHAPLACAGQLVDVVLLAREADPAELEALARRWGYRRLWRATRDAARALLVGGRAPAAMRACSPHLRAARERTLLERHVAELAAPAFGLAPARAATRTAAAIAWRLRPADGEGWARKAARARRALRHAHLRHSEHDARLAPRDLRLGAPRGLRPAPAPVHPSRRQPPAAPGPRALPAAGAAQAGEAPTGRSRRPREDR